MEKPNVESAIHDIDPEKLLKGIYESRRLPQELGEIATPDYGYNILNQKGCLYEPIIDKKTHSEPNWPDDKEFAVCLTHDVDHVTATSLKQAYRRFKQKMASHLRARKLDETSSVGGSVVDFARSFALEARYTTNTFRESGVDPLNCFERWLELEKSVGARSTFFFLPSPAYPYHVSDPEYRFSDEVMFNGKKITVGEMVRNIDQRGWEIGLHPTWYTFDDASKLRREKKELENVTGTTIESVRHHHLHYDIRETPRVHDEVGLKYDSTLGFNKNIGFRFGTSLPWYLYNLKAREQTDVLEVPLIIQDGALFRSKGLGLDEKTSLKYIKEIVKRVRSVNGVLTLLWHPGKIIQDKWWSVYKRTLEYLDDQDVWFATISELGEWCKKRGLFHDY